MHVLLLYVFNIHKYVFMHTHVLKFIHKAHSHIHEYAFIFANNEKTTVTSVMLDMHSEALRGTGRTLVCSEICKGLDVCVWNEFISASFSEPKLLGWHSATTASVLEVLGFLLQKHCCFCDIVSCLEVCRWRNMSCRKQVTIHVKCNAPSSYVLACCCSPGNTP